MKINLNLKKYFLVLLDRLDDRFIFLENEIGKIKGFENNIDRYNVY